MLQHAMQAVALSPAAAPHQMPAVLRELQGMQLRACNNSRSCIASLHCCNLGRHSCMHGNSLQEPCSLEAHRSWLPSSQVYVSLSRSLASPASATQNRRPPLRSSCACCGCTAASSVVIPAGVRIRRCEEVGFQHIVDLRVYSHMQSGDPPLSKPTRSSDSLLLPTMSVSCGKAWRSQH